MKKWLINNNSSKSFLTDDELVRHFVSGDDEAFSHLYDKFVGEMFAYGSAWEFNDDVLEDAIQDVFLKLYQKRDLLNNVKNIKLYLFKALKNRSYNIHKPKAEMYSLSDLRSHNELTFTIKSTVIDDLIDDENKKEIQQKVDSLLSKLTNRQREAIYLRFMQEMEYEEIALLLDMTPQSARKLVFRAMERMRETNLTIYLLFFSSCTYIKF